MAHILNTREISKDYNTIYSVDSDETNRAKLEMWMAKKIGEKLVSNYRNRQWGVDVDLPGQIIVITCPSVSLDKGYHISMVGRTISDLEERAIVGAGEIMERYGLSRKRVINEDVVAGLNVHPITGEAQVNNGSTAGEEPIKRGR